MTTKELPRSFVGFLYGVSSVCGVFAWTSVNSIGENCFMAVLTTLALGGAVVTVWDEVER
jgi:hypothetical protein